MSIHNDPASLVRKIRTQYTEPDAKVKRPANVFAYVYGSIGAIITGAGMRLVMTDELPQN